MSLAAQVQGLSNQQLASLLRMAQNEQIQRQEKVKDIYGERFCKLVGLERLYNLPEVEAGQLNLNVDIKYPEYQVRPSDLKTASVVRGIMGINWFRPFVAIKMELLDPSTKKVVDVVVEVVFKRYPLNDDGGKGNLMEHNYVSVIGQSKSGKAYLPFLHSAGGMLDTHLTALRSLLEGKEIPLPLGENYQRGESYLIRMAQEG